MSDDDLPRASISKDGSAIRGIVACLSCGSDRIEVVVGREGDAPSFECQGCKHTFPMERPLLKNEFLLIDSDLWRGYMADPSRKGSTISDEVGVRAVLLKDPVDDKGP
jgi:hypothetical protein